MGSSGTFTIHLKNSDRSELIEIEKKILENIDVLQVLFDYHQHYSPHGENWQNTKEKNKNFRSWGSAADEMSVIHSREQADSTQKWKQSSVSTTREKVPRSLSDR